MTTISSWITDTAKSYLNLVTAEPSTRQDTALIYPLIYGKDQFYNPKTDTAFVSYNKPGYFTTGFYKDLNKDKSVQKVITKYFYYKIIDKWLYNELLQLLAYLEIDDGKVSLIKNLSDYNVGKLARDTDRDIEKKIGYMEDILITKDMVKHVLKKIIRENNLNWYDLYKKESDVIKVFKDYISDKLEDAIDKKN
jgi:hypothetical protein